MTFNLRNSGAPDGDDAWPYRRERVGELLREHPCELYAFQEALPDQIAFLDQALQGYERIGVGREDGRSRGEHVPLYCHRDVLRLQEGGCFWLSERPESPGSRSWDSACPRIASWARLRIGGDELLAVNVHLDHASAEARRRGGELVGARMRDAGTGAAVLLGDFNCQSDDEPYRLLTSGDRPLLDARCVAGGAASGPAWSFHAFDPPGTELIDHVFVSPGMEVADFAALDRTFAGGWPSDHLPIVARLRL